ncbi:MAG: alpha/beta hydrolase [Nonlabens sp.]
MKKLLQKAIPKMYGFYFNLLNTFSPNKAATTALRVFCIPRRGKLNEEQAAYLSGARQQKVAYEHGLIQLYHWKGKGPTVLLVHGWESNTSRWKFLIDTLQEKEYNIIAFDGPAHGASDGETITAIMYSRVIATVAELYEPSFVIAHSMGAMATAYQQSQLNHDFVKKLVLLGSPNTLEVILRGYQSLTGFNNKTYGNLISYLEDSFKVKVETFTTADFVKNIKTPVLLAHSPEDQIVEYQCMMEIASDLPNVKTYTAMTGGHSLHTDEVVAAVMDFIED